MESWLFSPAWFMILGGIAMIFVTRMWRDILTIALPLLTLVHIWTIEPGEIATTTIADFELITVYVHAYSRIFATAFAIAAMGSGIFAMHARRKLEMGVGYVYAGSAIGVTFSGDFITFFIFWELMAIFSTLVIWSNRTPESRKAGLRYAIMHFFGGVLLMAGIAAHVEASGSTLLPSFALLPEVYEWTSSLFGQMLNTSTIGTWLILAGILVNVAAPPFSSWLSDAYPETSPSGMVFLSAFTTKTAVYALLTLFAGVNLLIPIGLFMVMYGIVMAILENDVRRILAFSIINQVGFMVTGIGIGSSLALHGAAAHAFCHILYKALLLMSAGSVLQMTGKRKCSELGGLFRSMPITCICGIIGALAISSFPATSGFVSKSLISSAAAAEQLTVVWFMLVAASAGVFLHAGIKFPWFVFFQKDSGLRPPDPPQNMQYAMIGFAAMCILPGLFPQQLLYSMLPEAIEYDANTFGHVVNQLQLLLFSGLAFFLCLPLLKRTLTITLDFDWLYRRLLTKLLILLERGALAGYTSIIKVALQQMQHTSDKVLKLTGPKGVMAETKTLANTTLIVAILLAAYLLFYLSN